MPSTREEPERPGVLGVAAPRPGVFGVFGEPRGDEGRALRATGSAGAGAGADARILAASAATASLAAAAAAATVTEPKAAFAAPAAATAFAEERAVSDPDPEAVGGKIGNAPPLPRGMAVGAMRGTLPLLAKRDGLAEAGIEGIEEAAGA